MKKNSGIKVLTTVVLSVVVLVFISSGSNKKVEPPISADTNNFNEAIASQFNDNIRDVSARLIETEKKLSRIETKNKELSQKNDVLSLSKEQGGVVIKQETSPDVLASLEALKKELASLKEQREQSGMIYPLAGSGENSTSSSFKAVKDLDVQRIKKPLSEAEIAYWQRLRQKYPSKFKKKVTKQAKKAKPKAIPYYTLPAGSDLGNTTLLSALVGEVPNEGKLMQPLFPFSAIISRGDLMASNGVPLPPEISGMKVNGYAIGVGSFLDNISCVRAYVTSVLFTFQDGHFVVLGQEQMKNSVDLVNNESLGYLTTPFGNPCIHGKYFTNAPRVLAAMMGAGGVQGLGNTLSQWQMSYFGNANGAAALPTGSFGKYAAGGAVAEGAVKASDWLEKRIQGSFDMVFVPASSPCRSTKEGPWCATKVSLHLTRNISIDKQPQGRLIDYGRMQEYIRDFTLR